MLRYIISLLPYSFYNQPIPINTSISKFKELEYADTSTVLNLITLYTPIIDSVLVNNYKDDEFIRQVIATIGLYGYNRQVEYVINYLDDLTQLDVIVTTINKLVSFTSVDKLKVSTYRRIYLGHLFKLPIDTYEEHGDMSSDALIWFLSVYKPNQLHKLLTHDMTCVSKEVLQQLLDITIRDYEYLYDISVNGFLTYCVCKDCDMSKSKVLSTRAGGILSDIIRYGIDGKLPYASKNDYRDIAHYIDNIWGTNMGKAFFVAYVDKDMKNKIRDECLDSIFHEHLSKLLK